MPAGPSPPLTGVGLSVGGLGVSPYPGAGTEVPGAPLGLQNPSQGWGCPRASAPRAAATPTRIPPHPGCPLQRERVPSPGVPQIRRVGGPRAASPAGFPPARSVLFPAAPRGQRARRHRCRRVGCQGAAICVCRAARLGGGGGGGTAPPNHPTSASGHCSTAGLGAPQNGILRALWGGGRLGRGPGPRGGEGSAGGPAAHPPAFLCGVAGPPSPPLGAIVAGRCCHPPRPCVPQAGGLPPPLPVGPCCVCVGPTETRGGVAGQRLAGLPRGTRPRDHPGTVRRCHPVPGRVSREGAVTQRVGGGGDPQILPSVLPPASAVPQPPRPRPTPGPIFGVRV
ncbi:translation initiation factor IF-2-like [Aquila chrysaetos chrysaetos]|uniref:translation initiation factor IF-2-like n=1 Tax=Aquila chrysaetos chrysaetos TaxID=223781 RepID=UPI001B7D355B|nr:translation initiation factor IF-2-like [Aquila chrysaetos chrysaetos]